MTKLFNEAVSLTIRLMVVFFGVVAVTTSCTEEHYGLDDDNEIGEETADFQYLSFNHNNWAYSNGLAKADHNYNGLVIVKKNGVEVRSINVEDQIAEQTITWEPVAEVTSNAAQKQFVEYACGDVKEISKENNQGMYITKFEKECTLTFVGMEVILKGSWKEASFNGKKADRCEYDYTTIITQVSDTVKVDGAKVEVIVEGEKFNRVNVTAKAENHFNDYKNGQKSVHVEQMDIVYSVLVPVNFVPGEKFYEGSSAVEGSGKYTKIDNNSYKSELTLTHYFTQDGVTTQEQETVSGVATVKTWVEAQGAKKVVSSIEIGNPNVSVNNTVSDMYLKEGNVYAKKYTTVWTYTWQNGFTKKVYAEVERLFFVREGKEVAMPYGETTTSFKNFVKGNSTEKSENGKKYDAYSSTVNFNGNHKSTTGNLNNAISGLSVGQEFWVEKPQTPDMPNEIGAVDITKTKQFGGLSWAWDASGKAFISGTIVTKNGVVSFWNGKYCFHKMTTSTIKARLGNSLYPENTNQYLIPSYIDVQSKPNKHWVYTDVNGKVRDEVYGTLIEKLEDVTLDKPFFGTPSETSETYQITSQDGSVRIKVVYKGSVVFDHVFAN